MANNKSNRGGTDSVTFDANEQDAHAPSKILLIFRSAPHSNAAGQEGLDAAMAAAASEAAVSLLFVHDGVFQIKQGQSSTQHSKNYTRAFAALPDFGVESFWIDDASMMARGLTLSDLSVTAQPLGIDAAAALLRAHDQVLVF